MKLINESSRPTEEVRRLVRIGMQGLDHKGVTVRVVDARKRAWDGKIYCTGLAWWGSHRIIIRIAPDQYFPYKGWRRHRASPLNHDYQSWQEALVALAAHEGKHIDLHRNGVKHTSRQKNEMACEAHEKWVLDRYRASC